MIQTRTSCSRLRRKQLRKLRDGVNWITSVHKTLVTYRYRQSTEANGSNKNTSTTPCNCHIIKYERKSIGSRRFIRNADMCK